MDGTDGTAIFSKKKVSELQIKSKKSDIPPRGRTLTYLFLKKGPKVSKIFEFSNLKYQVLKVYQLSIIMQ